MEAAFDKKFMEGLAKVEQVYKICGKPMGDEALSKYVGDYFIENNATLKAFRLDMKKYDKAQLQGSPASAHNLPRKDKPGVNYFAPQRRLTDICQKAEFEKVRSDKFFDNQWLEQFVTALMASEHRDSIAEQWSKSDQRQMLVGNVLGVLFNAGVFKGSRLKMARLYYDSETNTAEVKTLAKYMNDLKHCPYVEWVEEYVKKSREAQA